MAGQPGSFDAEGRPRWLSASGDPPERLRAVMDFEAFPAELEAALPCADRSCEKRRMGRVVRCIGLARATARIMLVNLA
ncbi:hypothetical protein [Belnapia sp. F-4-1]|uniref:hypothetical protein n=1 Tax=Belnapia sp. F-4-1 TaxID=1545443 RepID=UPI0005BC8451|nr:hypothetical protein [Belnapia sp. F-4-1]